MSLPPERISIKRRRQEEPVDTLILEQTSARDKKRRFTDFIFQRLHTDKVTAAAINPFSARPTTISTASVTQAAPDRHDSQIPTVRTSVPGDEIRDFDKYRAAQKETQERELTNKAKPIASKIENDGENDDHKSEHSSAAILNILAQRADRARRFHLTRDVSSALRPNSSGGIRRRKLNLRPPLATFVERRRAQYAHEDDSVYTKPPIDSIVHLKQELATNDAEIKPTPDSVKSKTAVNSFLKSKPPPVRLGHSIRDDPITWDHDSDQLADELSKLAFELDPDAMESEHELEPEIPVEVPMSKASQSTTEVMLIDNDDEYVFETYVRVSHTDSIELSPSEIGTDFGVLVIDEDDEDLWEKYVHSDDEDDWDEEDNDSNAEDNPRNDYPEDEVSTDDEFGSNVYRHRRYGSDQETYDDERDEW